MAASSGLKTQSALARKAGVAQSTIGRLLRGEVDPQMETLQRVANALGIPVSALLGKRTARTPVTSGDEIALEPTDRLRSIPLISYIEAGVPREVPETHPTGDTEVWMQCPRPCGPRSFALRVEGASMEPSYYNGDFIFVDPDIDAGHGQDVVVRLADRNAVTLKQLIIEGERTYLRSRNPNWPDRVIELPAGAQIVGVVIGKWVDP